MKRLMVIVFLAGRSLAFADGEAADSKSPQPPGVAVPHAPRAWLGLQVTRPDESITAHLPALPPGIGFMVRSIEPGGPAEAAGLKQYDVLWRLGDQMLVNEGQLAALLRLAKPGDEVTFAGFRAGQPLEVKLKLGEAPAGRRPFPGDLVDSAIFPGDCGSPMRVVNISEKLASYANDEGRAEIRRDGEVYKVRIQGPKDELIYQGDLPADGSLDKIPDGWKRRIHALRRGLDHALEDGMAPSRQPRPRVVPPAPQNP